MKYRYPQYQVDLTPQILAECRDIGQRTLEDVGLCVRHEKFVKAIQGHDGVKVVGDRVHLSRKLTEPYYEQYIAESELSQAVRESGSQASAAPAHGFAFGSALAGSQKVPSCTPLPVPPPEPWMRCRHSRLTTTPFGGSAPGVKPMR